MSFQSEFARRWQSWRQATDRTPLRIKLITAVLTLVLFALVVISAASVALFRDYQIRHASQQAAGLFEQALTQLHSPPRLYPGHALVLGSYLVVLRPPTGEYEGPASETSRPAVPTDPKWLAAHSGQLVSVPATTGNDNWRVITQRVNFSFVDSETGQIINQRDTLIVGVDLGDINGTIGRLIRIDIVVGVMILVGLAGAGVAIVRSSLRPLTDIERTAEQIASGDLTQRVPDRDPRTEVGRLGRALNAMLAQIEAAFHARAQSEAAARRSEERMRQFVADASHELRTPLTAIRGYAEYYRQRGGLENGGHENGAGDRAREAGREPISDPASSTSEADRLSSVDLDRIMERVEQESARMGMLVEDMLLLARVDQQRPIERRPVDLLTLAADAVQDARMIAPDRAIDLSVGTGAAFLVVGDEPRLRQVIGNLMSNALTHTPDGTPIDVRLLAGETPDHPPGATVILEVADQGPGLTREQAERAFERFYRADQSRGRRTGGAGLGLAIVSALVTAHGGTVSVKTAPSQGATFRITLPLAPEAQHHASET